MPIYAYRCAQCGHAQDVLQKISDPLLTVCPSCGASTFEKQLTAAGFQLKGSGWYVTDFRGGNTGAKPAAEGGDAPAGDGKPESATAPAAAAAPAAAGAPATAPAPAPAATPAPTAAPASSAKPSAKPGAAAGGKSAS
jgi:putative FmdB family regulatory protein